MAMGKPIAGDGSTMRKMVPEAERTRISNGLSEDMQSFIDRSIHVQYRAASDLFAGSAYRKEASANLITARLWKLIKR